MHRFAFGAVPLFLGLAACSPSPEGQPDEIATLAAGATAVESTAAELYAFRPAWPATGATFDIEYCRKNVDASIGTAELSRQWSMVGDALGRSWQRFTNLRFLDRGSCSTAGLGAKRRLEFNLNAGGGGGVCGLGAPAAGMPQTCSFSLGTIPGKSEEFNRETATGIIAHEVGHALSFEHEQDRPDQVPNGTLWCPQVTFNPIGSAGVGLLTPLYDDYSAMSYCGPESNKFRLSHGDVSGSQKIYGISPAGRWLKALPGITLTNL
jgi:hypothetical protein